MNIISNNLVDSVIQNCQCKQITKYINFLLYSWSLCSLLSFPQIYYFFYYPPYYFNDLLSTRSFSSDCSATPRPLDLQHNIGSIFQHRPVVLCGTIISRAFSVRLVVISILYQNDHTCLYLGNSRISRTCYISKKESRESMVNVALLKVLSPAHPNLRNLSLSRLSSLFCIFRGHRIKDSLLAFDSILLITILFYYYFNCGIFYFRLANNHILHYYFDLFYLATYLYFCISYLDRNRSQTSAIFIIHQFFSLIISNFFLCVIIIFMTFYHIQKSIYPYICLTSKTIYFDLCPCTCHSLSIFIFIFTCLCLFISTQTSIFLCAHPSLILAQQSVTLISLFIFYAFFSTFIVSSLNPSSFWLQFF